MLNKSKTMHIIQLGDIIEHNLDASYTDEFICICNPTVDYEKGIIIHHAMDGRPAYLEDDN